MIKRVARDEAELYPLPGRNWYTYIGPQNTPTERVSMGVSIFPAGSRPTGHVHDTQEETIYCAAGRGRIVTADATAEIEALAGESDPARRLAAIAPAFRADPAIPLVVPDRRAAISAVQDADGNPVSLHEIPGELHAPRADLVVTIIVPAPNMRADGVAPASLGGAVKLVAVAANPVAGVILGLRRLPIIRPGGFGIGLPVDQVGIAADEV